MKKRTIHLLQNRTFLFVANIDTDASRMPAAVDREAQPIAALLLARGGYLASARACVKNGKPRCRHCQRNERTRCVDVAALELHRPRSVCVEQLGLWAMQQLGFIELLTCLSINGAQRVRTRHFNSEQAIDIETATGDTVRGQKTLSEDGQEVRLYCSSPARSQKEEAIAKRYCELFGAELDATVDGLFRPPTEKRITKLWERIGRLKDKAHGIGQHYHIELQADESGTFATALTWTKQASEGSLVTHPGVYRLRSNETAGMPRNCGVLTSC
jgi:hypothetical protein